MEATKLSSKDLMVGDWMYITDYPMRKEIKQVKPEHFLRSLVTFDPIQLTPKMLKKNGFSCDRNDGYAILRLEDNSELLYYFHEHKLTRFYKSEIIFRCQCVYAHQLQHAFKICGIDKEIVV